jgi:hypothetical protein
MRKHACDVLLYSKSRRGKRFPLWLWRSPIAATGYGLSEHLLPVRTENK